MYIVEYQIHSNELSWDSASHLFSIYLKEVKSSSWSHRAKNLALIDERLMDKGKRRAVYYYMPCKKEQNLAFVKQKMKLEDISEMK